MTWRRYDAKIDPEEVEIPEGLTAPEEVDYLVERGVAPDAAWARGLDRHPEFKLPEGFNL